MASVKNLKKDINYTLGDIIGYASEKIDAKGNNKKVEEVIDDTINVFDDLIEKINKKNVENKKDHFNKINKELEAKATELVARVNKI